MNSPWQGSFFYEEGILNIIFIHIFRPEGIIYLLLIIVLVFRLGSPRLETTRPLGTPPLPLSTPSHCPLLVKLFEIYESLVFVQASRLSATFLLKCSSVKRVS